MPQRQGRYKLYPTPRCVLLEFIISLFAGTKATLLLYNICSKCSRGKCHYLTTMSLQKRTWPSSLTINISGKQYNVHKISHILNIVFFILAGEDICSP